MNIAVIGAAGKAGTTILTEALTRGHQVTAVIRHPEKLQKELPFIQKDLFDLQKEDITGFDVVVNAISAPRGNEQLHVEAGRFLIDLLSGMSEKRLLVVGGAGSLYTDETKTQQVMDSKGFPDFIYPTALNQAKNLADLEQTRELNWTFVSPSANFAVGRRTGHYHTGSDILLVNSQGQSYVSYEDFAAALLDEIEQPKHINQRFTVVSELD